MKRRVSLAILLAALMALPAIAQYQSSGVGNPSAQEGVSPDIATPPAGEIARYTLPYFYSVAGASGDRSVAVINVMNQTTVACDVTVEFQYATQTSDICSITATIAPKQSEIFCSRSVFDPVAPCHIVCPSGGLTFNEGHAFIDSTNSTACSNIAVDAREFFLRDPSDTLVDSSSQLTIVKYNLKNNGD